MHISPMAIIACDIMNEYIHVYLVLQIGRTPLHHAAINGYQEAVKILADGGATIDITDEVS